VDFQSFFVILGDRQVPVTIDCLNLQKLKQAHLHFHGRIYVVIDYTNILFDKETVYGIQ